MTSRSLRTLLGVWALGGALVAVARAEPRQVMSLDGVWNFATDPDNRGETEKWYQPAAKLPADAVARLCPGGQRQDSRARHLGQPGLRHGDRQAPPQLHRQRLVQAAGRDSARLGRAAACSWPSPASAATPRCGSTTTSWANTSATCRPSEYDVTDMPRPARRRRSRSRSTPSSGGTSTPCTAARSWPTTWTWLGAAFGDTCCWRPGPTPG